MDMSEIIKKKIKDKFGINKKINDNFLLGKHLDADSLDIMELIIEIEDEFHIQIDDMLIDEKTKVGELIKIVENSK